MFETSNLWSQTYKFFKQNRNEFRKHYHKGSNAETVFHMIKRKIGLKLRNKKDTSQVNEVLIKCLAHNIIVLIHEMYELGVDIDFDFCAEKVLA